MLRSRRQLEARVKALERLCAEMYQVAGAAGAPVRVLNRLSAAAAGRPFSRRSVLPVSDAEFWGGWRLSRRDTKRLLSMLDNPPAPNKALRQAFKR